MSAYNSDLGVSGVVAAKLFKAPKAPLAWRIENSTRWGYLFGRATNWFAKGLTRFSGIPTLTSELKVKVIHANGDVTNYGVVSYRLVTTAFVEYMVDQMIAEDSAWGDFKFHDSGVGTTAAAVGDTDIETTDGETRATGTQLEGASGEIYKSVGTISYTSTKAITEHILANIATAGICLDRHVFSAINVDNGDSIQFTYELTVSDGG